MSQQFRYGLSLRIYGEEKAFGPGIASLLRQVERTGSLQKAAVSMGMSYSKAWKILKETEGQWGFPMTNRETGGRDGGGSTLTAAAREIWDHYGRVGGVSRAARAGVCGGRSVRVPVGLPPDRASWSVAAA